MSRLGQREGGHRRQVAHVHEGRPAAPYRDHDVVTQPDVISVGSAEVLHEERHAQKDVLQARAFQVLPDGVVRHQRIALRPLNRQEGHGPDACCPHGIDGRIDQLLRVADGVALEFVHEPALRAKSCGNSLYHRICALRCR
jgi:hypothetical protein